MPETPAFQAPATASDPLADSASSRAAEELAFESEVVAFFVDTADLLGVPKSVATIYGVLFASAVPLSFAEIEARVKFSKGSVSQGLRVLREVGAIKESAGAAVKTRNVQHYEPDMALRKLILRFIDQRLQTQLDTGSNRLGRIQAAVPLNDEAAVVVLRKRIKQLSSWHEQTRALLPVAKTFLKIAR